MNGLSAFLAAVASTLLLFQALPVSGSPSLSPKEQLGKFLFFDTNLSAPPGQACASCHAPEAGFTGPHSEINTAGAVYEGATKGRFGDRKPPAAAYAGYSPVLRFDRKDDVWVGGMFWDGRATGKRLKDPLAEQAQGPFLNPLEHNLPDMKAACAKVRAADYASLFERVWGKGSLDCGKGASATYDRIGRSIAAYERSREVNPFSSRFDYWLKAGTGLSEQELLGRKLFEEKGKCAECHPSKPGSDGVPPLFTDHTYDNLGIPKNPRNPFYKTPAPWNPQGEAYVDSGLGGYLKKAGYGKSQYESETGKVKVPTLRNVDKRPAPEFVKAYGHNGYFKSLKAIVHFYNTRDALARCETLKDPRPGDNCWPQPEVPANLNRDELGNLGLTEAEEDAIVAFMKTLSDGHAPGK